jgi:hypothetical protein
MLFPIHDHDTIFFDAVDCRPTLTIFIVPP